MKKAIYKEGDRIFYEYYDGDIGEAIISRVEHDYYINDKNCRVNYNKLHIDKYSYIEDYNCLSEEDPRVIKYKKNHEDPRVFKEKCENFLKENNFNIKQNYIQNYLLKKLQN